MDAASAASTDAAVKAFHTPSPQEAALRKAQQPNPQLQPTTPTAGTIDQPKLDMPQLVMRPKRGGMLGVMDKMADALTGTTRPEIYTDQDGNEYVYHANMSRGQQWARIGAGMFKGAAAGLAAGRGAGNMGKAALAGVEAGEQQQKEQQEREETLSQKAQKDMLNRANMTMLRMQQIEQAWRAARLQPEANEKDAEASQKMIEFYTKTLGGTVLGTAAHPGDLGTVMKVEPNLAEKFMKDHIVEPVATVDAQGHHGVTFIRMPNADWRNKTLPPNSTFSQFDPATGTVKQQQASDAMTMGAWADQERSAYNDKMKYDNDLQDRATKKAAQGESEQKTEESKQMLPYKKAESKATTVEKYAGAAKQKEDVKMTEWQMGGGAAGQGGGAGTLYEGSTGNPMADQALMRWPAAIQANVRGLVDYTSDPKSFPPRVSAKTGQMDQETAEGIAKMIDPSWDHKTFQQRQETRDDFMKLNGTGGGTIQAINTAIHHAGLLNDAIAELDNHHWKITNWAMNKYKDQKDNPSYGKFMVNRDGLASELAAGYKGGNSPTQGEINDWKNNVSVNSGINTQRGNVQKAMEMLAGKVNTLYDFYESTMGRPPDFDFIDNPSKAALAKIPGGQAILDIEKNRTKPIGGRLTENPVNAAANVGHPATDAKPPQEGDIKVNSSGVRVKFTNGAWGPA